MTTSFSWKCPYCQHQATITDSNHQSSSNDFFNNNKDGWLRTVIETVTCPNEACRDYEIKFELVQMRGGGANRPYIPARTPLISLILKPSSNTQSFPEYVPIAIRTDYQEAALIRQLSPKASATLSRRCLQGMIRDRWKVNKRNLVDAIDAIKEQIDSESWQAITAVRHLGNIGAHMETDINTIVDVDETEAELLVGLIETLIQEWYVELHERQLRMRKVADAARAKGKPIPEPGEKRES